MRTESTGDFYTLHHTMIHLVTAQPYTTSLIIRGPAVKDRPRALVASYEWEQYVDIVTIRGFERVTVARVPQRGKVDVFAPDVVVWSYEGPAEPALRALLNLVHPQHLDAPATAYPAPRSWHIPRHAQRRLRIRFPSASGASARAARLAATMTTELRHRRHIAGPRNAPLLGGNGRGACEVGF
ncbi:MAG: hypothetical protein ACRDTH_27755 [Pseudonocardiaceae bacterium]